MNKTDLPTFLKNLKTNQLKIVGPFYSGPALDAENVIYVDAGTKFKTSPLGFSVGDGDSYSGNLDQTLPKTKDDSDLAYVLKCIQNPEPLIDLLGFRGGRADHDLINLAEVHRFLKQTRDAIVHFDDQIIAYSGGSWEFEFNGTFSLFAFEKVNIQMSGACQYPIDQKTEFQELSSHGLSNRASGIVTVECDRPFFIFKNHLECATTRLELTNENGGNL